MQMSDAGCAWEEECSTCRVGTRNVYVHRSEFSITELIRPWPQSTALTCIFCFIPESELKKAHFPGARLLYQRNKNRPNFCLSYGSNSKVCPVQQGEKFCVCSQFSYNAQCPLPFGWLHSVFQAIPTCTLPTVLQGKNNQSSPTSCFLSLIVPFFEEVIFNILWMARQFGW